MGYENFEKENVLGWLTVPLAIAVINLLANGGEPIYLLWVVGILSYSIGIYYIFYPGKATKKKSEVK